MRVWPHAFIALVAASSAALAQPVRTINAHAPDRTRSAEIRGVSGDDGGNEIWLIDQHGPARRLVAAQENADPPRNLQGFDQPLFSNDGRTLYFNSRAWVTSSALHAVDVVSGQERFIIDGGLIGIVLGGRLGGDLIVLRHRYHAGPNGGSYEAATLVSPRGQSMSVISTADEPLAAVEAWVQRHGGRLRQPAR